MTRVQQLTRKSDHLQRRRGRPKGSKDVQPRRRRHFEAKNTDHAKYQLGRCKHHRLRRSGLAGAATAWVLRRGFWVSWRPEYQQLRR